MTNEQEGIIAILKEENSKLRRRLAAKGEQVDRLKCCANCVHHYRGVSTFVACCCNVHGNLHQFEDRCDKWEGGEE